MVLTHSFGATNKMNLFFKALVLIGLATANGFAAGKTLIECTASSTFHSRSISRMIEHRGTSQTIHSMPISFESRTTLRAAHRLPWRNEHVREVRLNPRLM